MRAYLSWITAAAFVFFQFFLQSTATLMSEDWLQDFHLNQLELSYLSSSFFYSYILMQIPIGILYDRFSTKKILFGAAAILSVGCLGISYAKHFPLALLSRFLMGLGSACGFVGLLTVISKNFIPNRFALMFGIAEAIGMAAVSFGVVLLPSFLQAHSWRDAMFLSGLLAAALALAMLIFIKDRNHLQQATISLSQIISQIKATFLNRQFLLGSLYSFFIVAIMNCFTSLWGEPFLMHTYNFDSQSISNLISAVFIGLACGSPLNGWFAKRYGNTRQLMIWEAGLAALATSFVIFIPNLSPSLLYFLFFLSGFFCTSYVPCFAMIKESVNREVESTAIATANMIVVASAPALQVAVGGLLETNCFGCVADQAQNFRVALSILPLSYVLAFGISFFVWKDQLCIEKN